MRIGSLSDIRRAPMRRSPFVSGFLLGPELVVNGTPMAATGWLVENADGTHIVTFSGGTCRYQSAATTPVLSVSQAILTVGKRYQVQVICSSYASGSIKTDSFSTVNQLMANSAGTRVFESTAVTNIFSFVRNGSNVDITFSSISVKEILN